MLYRLLLRILRTRRGAVAWRYASHWRWRTTGRGAPVGSYSELEGHVRGRVAGRSFLDVGCMWGVNGKFVFTAEEAGAARAAGIDVFGPTPEFERQHRERGSSAEFILGDATDDAMIRHLGEWDVVLCAGVLYHHPSPYELITALRRLCRYTLILRSSTIPELPGLRNAAVYWPMLPVAQRRIWDLRALGVPNQVGITNGFEPEHGYGNWFWGLTPSAVEALLGTAGFRVVARRTEPFAQTFVCEVVARPFGHRVPDEDEARRVAADISVRGLATPA